MSAAFRAYAPPTVGDVVWTRFPHDLLHPAPAPKPRPAMVLRVRDPIGEGGPCQVDVCPGTSQNLNRIYPHEFPVHREQHPAEYTQMGLSYDTKFDLRRIASLEYTSEWFAPPPKPKFGANPKLGSMHAASVPRLMAAYKAVRR
jgi:hypothetical protein